LFDAIRAGGTVDVMRQTRTLALQELIELDATQAIGAGRCKRTGERIARRNGTRSRLLSTRAGDVELRIP
jgi:transposase-like protein